MGKGHWSGGLAVLCPRWVVSQILWEVAGGSTSASVSAPLTLTSPRLRQQEAPDLFQWLCSDSLKLCCPSGTFGPSCVREFFRFLLGDERGLLRPGIDLLKVQNRPHHFSAPNLPVVSHFTHNEISAPFCGLRALCLHLLPLSHLLTPNPATSQIHQGQSHSVQIPSLTVTQLASSLQVSVRTSHLEHHASHHSVVLLA